MKVEIMEQEIHEIVIAMILASEHKESMNLNWEIFSKFLAKLDK